MKKKRGGQKKKKGNVPVTDFIYDSSGSFRLL